jgi:uncharacterized lipoprotein YehR (DUF1307 family)
MKMKIVVLVVIMILTLVGCTDPEQSQIREDLNFYFEQDIVSIKFEGKIVKVTFEDDLVHDIILGANANLTTIPEYKTLQDFEKAWREVSEYHDEYEFWLVNEKYLDEPLKTKRGNTK